MDEGREARLRAAVGPRADHYLGQWKKMDETGRRASWNWAACLLNVFWFAYRKMWVPMLAMGLLYLVATPLIDPADPTQLRIVMFTLVGLSFLTGTFGNWLYRRQVEQLVARTAAVDDEASRAALKAKGGTSVAAAIGAFVGLTVLSLVAGMIPALLAQP